MTAEQIIEAVILAGGLLIGFGAGVLAEHWRIGRKTVRAKVVGS